MKFRKNKIKYMLLAGGIISISAILPITLLTSCSSTSNPYGPYTVITNNSTGNIRYSIEGYAIYLQGRWNYGGYQA